MIPDRLVGAKNLEIYPSNPFRKNVKGLTNNEIPMTNIWGMEWTDPIDNSGINPLHFHLSYPLFYTNVANGGVYNFPDPGDYSGVGDFDYWWLGDWRGTVWGAEYNADPTLADYLVEAREQNKYFPEGDFAYIPLDPVQTDATNPQFMRFCKSYWLIVYGSKRTALKNKYKDVWPNFPRPLGDGAHDPTNPLLTCNTFELAVKSALTGALHVYGTKYTDQLGVSGVD